MFHPRRVALKEPEKAAYIMADSGKVVTYGAMERRVNQCSQYFRKIDLSEEDNICIFLENNEYFLEIAWAAQVAGLYYSPVSTYLKKNELVYIVNNSESKLFVTSYALKDVVADIADQCPTVKHWLMIGGTTGNFISYEKEIENCPETPIPECMEGQEMLYSSGTTGAPKGVLSFAERMPFGKMPPSVWTIIDLYGLNGVTVYLSPGPLYHAVGLRFCMWTMRMGGTAIVMGKFDALKALQYVERYKVTHSHWVPTMFIRMLKLDEEKRHQYDLSTQRYAIHAAAPCPKEVKEKMIQWWGPIIYEYYGGTEANTFVAINSEEWLAHKGSVGKCFVGKLHILDEQDNEMPIGQPGIIFVEGGGDFEYYKDPEKTRTSRNSKGWSNIGDVGYLDDEDYLYLTDRKSNMIISGGVNIYPQETENLLSLHPKVLDAAVIGIPNEDFGEEVKAVVQPVDMAEAGPELENELQAYCLENLSKIKCPKSIDFQETLPRTPTGKLLKRFLREKYLRDS